MVEETEDSMTVRFKCILRIRKDEFVTLARDIMEQKGIEDYAGRLQYDDKMVAINDDGRYMNVLRKANHNPTTCVKDAGYGECIRHHGEHIYLIKHLLKLSAGLSE